jgi:CheY-like chemotaxis protein
MLEAERFTLLLCDLRMPGMDGLQVLAIVRRRFPQLRTAVLTGLTDEQYRQRAYAMGVDLYLEKPTTHQGVKLLLDCIESLLGQEDQGGFRGMESRSLVDIIQLECLTQSSRVLKIKSGVQEGRIWFLNGDIIDAATQDLVGEAAFAKMLAWKTGNFEILPPEPDHTRTIFNSYQGLLLETAQALDEAQAQTEAGSAAAAAPSLAHVPPVTTLSRVKGVEFGLVLGADEKSLLEAWAVENPQPLADWTRQMLEGFAALGEELHAGQLNQIECIGFQHRTILAAQASRQFCVGFQRSVSAQKIQEAMNNIFTKWVS